ncbi:unnamed protein product [Caenorhabditis bovis]|uniref:Uncharacterized protein n=1 Tax=Caenorhabditis bovis TaxID=2654633 RepID=A0A8S1F201_9PELO|nr:unnamed protein product [Caenorhabditis bovis]
MFAEPASKRKRLNSGDSLVVERTIEIQADSPSTSKTSKPDVPIKWIINGVNLEERIAKLREEIAKHGSSVIPLVDPRDKSVFRSEFRKMASAVEVVEAAMAQQTKQIEWMKNAEVLLDRDTANLQKRCEHLVKEVDELRNQLVVLNSNITAQTQRAVQAVVDIRCEENLLDVFDCNENRDELYEKYRSISRLCVGEFCCE